MGCSLSCIDLPLSAFSYKFASLLVCSNIVSVCRDLIVCNEAWAVGRVRTQVGTEWGVPRQLQGLPAAGIRCISAGARASSAVTGDGELYIWGRLMAEDNARCQIRP